MDHEELLERIGLLHDKVENLLGASRLPLSPAIHLQGLIHGLTEVAAELDLIHDILSPPDESGVRLSDEG